ncbi:MAG: hypothetical protein GY699_02725 [Desulfobacteraceae bacterium]|nr:hypothetical protein [Desulfobacteraceae bacterium]
MVYKDKNGKVIDIIKGGDSYGTATDTGAKETLQEAKSRLKLHKKQGELSRDRTVRGQKPKGTIQDV